MITYAARAALAAAVFLAVPPVAADLPGAPKPVAGSLLDTKIENTAFQGRWSVTMLHGEDEEPVIEELVISSASPSNLQGGFLGAAFSESAMRQVGKSIIFHAQTDDGTGPVYHSGRMTGTFIQGQSYFSGRGELLPWTGEKVVSED
ncbi:MAG: hypothetical protein AAF337_10785 [Pseudomonadota bacterium]